MPRLHTPRKSSAKTRNRICGYTEQDPRKHRTLPTASPSIVIDGLVCFIPKKSFYIFLEHFDFEPFAFICKPVDEKVLGRVFEKLENKYKSSGTILHMRRSSKELLINTNELMYVESNRWYVVLHTVHGNEKVRAKLSAVSAMLPDRFVVSHKSYIVNPDFIRSFDSVSVVMQNGDILPISRSRKNEFRDKVLSAKGFEQ